MKLIMALEIVCSLALDNALDAEKETYLPLRKEAKRQADALQTVYRFLDRMKGKKS